LYGRPFCGGVWIGCWCGWGVGRLQALNAEGVSATLVRARQVRLRLLGNLARDAFLSFSLRDAHLLYVYDHRTGYIK
jgi:hypothetical protein